DADETRDKADYEYVDIRHSPLPPPPFAIYKTRPIHFGLPVNRPERCCPGGFTFQKDIPSDTVIIDGQVSGNGVPPTMENGQDVPFISGTCSIRHLIFREKWGNGLNHNPFD